MAAGWAGPHPVFEKLNSWLEKTPIFKYCWCEGNRSATPAGLGEDWGCSMSLT